MAQLPRPRLRGGAIGTIQRELVLPASGTDHQLTVIGKHGHGLHLDNRDPAHLRPTTDGHRERVPASPTRRAHPLAELLAAIRGRADPRRSPPGRRPGPRVAIVQAGYRFGGDGAPPDDRGRRGCRCWRRAFGNRDHHATPLRCNFAGSSTINRPPRVHDDLEVRRHSFPARGEHGGRVPPRVRPCLGSVSPRFSNPVSRSRRRSTRSRSRGRC